ncbi:recombinase family protein [Oceanicola sp. D3]|uniref:recombinase family protein n=1 Tax=Oceanicola sp. D3 TaxID=2587163 RepID=UPI00111E0A72|nr:recombinase family protein [Oceanicola sp. D3]QDC11712.1 recombinase family protein [Oceanicola sp. D3]
MPERRRAAIYARYSTDLQSDRSVEDQIALCSTYAAREGLSVTRTYHDRAKSSASMLGRDGLLTLMEDARAGAFDVLVVEAIDRISRDQEDLAGLHKRLEFAGVEIRTVHGGRASMIEIGVQGLMGQIFLAQNKEKIRRGLAGVVRDGRNPGGRAYGYTPVPGQPGELTIVEAEAEVIRRICQDYVSGKGPKAIAAELNAEGIAPPRGARWNSSTLHGNPARGYGILCNPLYDGRVVWNRVHMVLDPDTGKRVSRTNPMSEWHEAEAEHLRIVPAELWADVERVRESRKGMRGRRHTFAPARPFSGLLRCGCCGAGMSIQKRRGTSIWLRCSRRAESGDCKQRKRPRLDKIETAIFERLTEELRDPAYAKAYLDEYSAERQRLARTAGKARARLEREAARARAAYDRAYRLYVDGVTDGDKAKADILAKRIAAEQAEARLVDRDAEVPVLEIHPVAADRYRQALVQLQQETDPEALRTIRELVSEVVITPTKNGHDVEVKGYISALVGPECRQMLVAEEGLEPPTRGL